MGLLWKMTPSGRCRARRVHKNHDFFDAKRRKIIESHAQDHALVSPWLGPALGTFKKSNKWAPSAPRGNVLSGSAKPRRRLEHVLFKSELFTSEPTFCFY